MQYATYTLTGEHLTPAVIRVGDHETPVWMQQRWEEGGFAGFIVQNGCGHCCVAMAARLHGVMIDPYEEFLHCRKLWGEPNETQGPWLSASGVVKSLQALGVAAEGFGVKPMGVKKAMETILAALHGGKQVIFTSNPDDDPENPFSKGYQWVMAVSMQEDGSVLIANSSEKAAVNGIQTVLPETIERALFRESTAPEDMTWGEADCIHEGSGFIIVG